jgi:hypothetical protein
MVGGIPRKDFGADRRNGVALEIERRFIEAFVSRDGRIVFKRSNNIQCHIHLEQGLVQVTGRAIRVKSGPHRDDMILGGADCPLRPVRVLDMWRNQVPLHLECLGHRQKGLTLLVVHPDHVDHDVMLPKKLHGLFEGDGGVFMTEAWKRLDIYISTPTADLKVACPR